MRVSRAAVVSLFASATLLACNQLFGINEPNPVDVPNDAGSNDSTVNETDGPTTADVQTDGVVDAPPDGTPSAPPPPLWMFAGVSLAEQKAEVSLVTPDGGAASLVGRLILPSSDAIAYASNGRAFLLNRKNGVVFVLDRVSVTDVTKVMRIETSENSADYDSNPYAVVVANATQAYVVRYAQNRVALADLSQSNGNGVIPVQKLIDLSVFNAASDADGVIEMAAAVYVPSTKFVYVALQRIKKGFPAECTEGSLIVAIDTTTNEIADLNGDHISDRNDAIPLLGGNPMSLVADEAHDRLLVHNTGCRTGAAVVGGQIDEVNFKTRATRTFVSNVRDSLAFLYIKESIAYVQASDGTWRKVDSDAGTIGGAVISQIPSVPFIDSQGFIVGLQDDTPAGDAGRHWSVYRVDQEAQLSTRVLASPFDQIEAANVYFLSSALVQ